MLQFVRQISIPIRIHKTLSHRRGFLFHVAAGFTGDVDPESGMIVNLVLADQWLKELYQDLTSQEHEIPAGVETLNDLFADLHKKAQSLLTAHAQTHNVKLASLVFTEERGFGFGSYLVPIQVTQDLEFFNSHHLEMLSPTSAGGLSKVTLFWQHAPGSESDYSHESFKLLKPLMQRKAFDLIEGLQEIKGQALPSGSFLSRIELRDLEKQITLEI